MTGIRPYASEDGPAVAELIERCLREVNSRDYPAEIIERMCAHFTPTRLTELAQQREIVVAESESETETGPESGPGRIDGTVSRDGNKVYTMFVHPRAAGRGLGRQLMRHIELRAAADGFDHMETGASITAHGFYQRLGYVDVRTSETDFGFNFILRKPLP